MRAIDWTEALSCGLDELDADHRGLIDHMNRLDSLAAEGADHDTQAAALADLVAAVAGHVEHEDRVLRRHGFHESAGHKAEDHKLLSLYDGVLEVFQQDRHETLTREVRSLLAHLMLHHIIRTDRPLREFFGDHASQPVTPAGRLQWLDSFALGVRGLDDDHRRFIDIINRMADCLAEADHPGLVDALEDFAGHAGAHFHREESFLESLGAPHSAEHKHEHMVLNRELFGLVEELRRDPAAFGDADLMALVKDWVIRHILFVDMKMKSYLHEVLREGGDRN